MSDNATLVCIVAAVCGSTAAVRITAYLTARRGPATSAKQKRDRAQETDRG